MNDQLETGPGTPAKDLVMIDGTFAYVDYNVAQYIRRLEKEAQYADVHLDIQQKYAKLIDTVAALREQLSKRDPVFVYYYIAEMVSCPQECALLLLEHAKHGSKSIPLKYKLNYYWFQFKRWVYA